MDTPDDPNLDEIVYWVIIFIFILMMSQELYLYKLYKYIKVNSLLYVKIKSLGEETLEIL